MADAVGACLRETRGRCCVFCRARPRSSGAPRSWQSDRRTCRRRDRPAARIARRGGTGPRDRADVAAADDPGDEHRRDVADGARRHGGRRPGLAQSRALRSGARRRQPETERISPDSADQRAGRAGRLGPGVAWRLWDQPEAAAASRAGHPPGRSLRPAARHPRVGRRPATFDWFDPPAPERVDAAIELLERLGAIDATVADAARTADAPAAAPPAASRAFCSPPAARATPRWAARCCRSVTICRAARIDDRQRSAVRRRRERDLPPHVLADGAHRCSDSSTRPCQSIGRRSARSAARSLRVIPIASRRRRAPGSPRVLLASGHGAVIGRESGVRDGEFLVALDVGRTAGRGGRSADPDREHRRSGVVVADADARRARARSRCRSRARLVARLLRRAGARRTYVPADAEERRGCSRRGVSARGLTDADEQLLRRLRFAGLDATSRLAGRPRREALARSSDLEVERALTGDSAAARSWRRRRSPCPADVHPLDYQAGRIGPRTVKLQELFGLGDTPRIGARASRCCWCCSPPTAGRCR